MSDRASSSSATALFAVGPPSPASPATGFLKETHHPSYLSSDQQTQQTPQTPTSPPLMSVSAQSHASSNNFTSSQASPSHATAQHPAPPANLSSPPSSVPMSSQVSQQPTVTSSATNSFPTPASSVNDHMGGIESEQTDKLMGVGAAPAPAPAPATAEYTRTDHDRQPLGGTDPGSGVRDFANRPDDDAMDIDRKAEMVGNSNSGFGLDSLQREFASAYHLCKSSHVATGPDPSLDLISLYGLGPVAKSVARIDPITGEKINRLRKSYEGKLKPLGLAGRNKPLKQEPGMPGSLRHLTMWPEEEWQNQKVYGKEIKVATIDSQLQQLQQAMKMESGTVPNNDYWEDVLGHEKPSKHAAGAGDGGKKAGAATSGGIARTTSQSNGTPTPAEPERTRPSRGRKRNYDDNSFAGYGEGYADDDDESAFYSNSESVGKKKRKKV